LTAPTSLTVADEDVDRRFITDQTGQIYVHGPDGLEDEPFLDVSDQLVEFMEFDERGLLGLAFHPDFADNGRFYVRYSSPPRDGTPKEYDHTFVLSEFQTAGDDNAQADPDSERVLLEIPEPQFNHNSGNICFGPDGYLYVGTGDGGGANDTGTGHVGDWYDENDGGNGQDTQANLLGAILRIDVDQEGEATPYAIPDDNPLVDQEGELGEHYVRGFRNPWGMSVTDGGELLAADVGQNLFESVNHVQRGGNYSWNITEGTRCFSTGTPLDPPQNCPQRTPDDVRGGEPLLDPVIEYPHEVSVLEPELGAENGGGNETAAGNETTGGTGGGAGVSSGQIGVSVTGGSLYESDEISDLEGAYVFGDWSLDGESPGTVFLARPPEGWQDTEGEATGESGQDGLWPIEQLQLEGEAAENGRPTGFVYAFGEGADGEIYVLTTSTSTVEGEGAPLPRPSRWPWWCGTGRWRRCRD